MISPLNIVTIPENRDLQEAPASRRTPLALSFMTIFFWVIGIEDMDSVAVRSSMLETFLG